MNFRNAVKYVTLFLILCQSVALQATFGDSKYRYVRDLPEGYKTDGFCIPGHGKHYINLDEPLYNRAIYIANKYGRLVGVSYKYARDTHSVAHEESEEEISLDTNLSRNIRRVLRKFSSEESIRAELPPPVQEMVCSEDLPPEYNMCRDHYEIHMYIIKDHSRKRLCGGGGH